MTLYNLMFTLESGTKLSGISLENYINLLNKLKTDAGIESGVIEEAASFSMAMVIRVALGLDSKDAHIAVLVNNSFASQIALATLRQLINSGATGLIILANDVDLEDPELLRQLKYHEHIQTEVFPWTKDVSNEEISILLENQDTLLSGLFDFDLNKQNELLRIIEVLNEIETPIHSLISPIGVNPNTGARLAGSLVSASTLSIGVPLEGLSNCKDQVGRHYVCDISLSKDLLKAFNLDLPLLFNEQPVVQIF